MSYYPTTGSDEAVDRSLDDARTVLLNKVAWGAVFAGMATALATQVVLNLLGVGIGAATLDPGTGDNPQASTLSIGAGAWWAISGILASLAGGFVAGRLSGKPKDSTAGWHGFISWAATTLVIFYLLTTSLGAILGGAYRTVTGALGGAAQTIGSTAQTAAQAAAPGLAQAADPFGAIESQVRSASGNDPAALRDAAVTAMRAAVTGDQAQAQAARDRAAEALAKAQNISPDEAKAKVAQYEQQYRQTVEQAKQKATEAADMAAKTVSRGALMAALSLVLGAIAGWFGGKAGAVHPTIAQTLAEDRRLRSS